MSSEKEKDSDSIPYIHSSRIDSNGHINEGPLSPEDRMQLLLTLPAETSEDLHILGLLFDEDE